MHDTVIVYSGKTWNKIKRKIERHLFQIKMWFDFCSFSINFSKTVYLPFTSYSLGLPSFSSIEFSPDTQIIFFNEVKYDKWSLLIGPTHKIFRNCSV